MSLKGKHVLRIKDLSTSDVKDLVESAAKLDKKTLPVCKGKHAVCFFSKSSTRTKSA
ncbi:hypothetical protein FACS189496_3950 [Bacilli bacterium]|nr:hypothetical protein FACS189496_3950 [Bacilli bacterium]